MSNFRLIRGIGRHKLAALNEVVDTRRDMMPIGAGTQEERVRLNVSGLPDGKVVTAIDVYSTDAEHDLMLTGSVKPGASYRVPARSTTTFVVTLGTP